MPLRKRSISSISYAFNRWCRLVVQVSLLKDCGPGFCHVDRPRRLPTSGMSTSQRSRKKRNFLRLLHLCTMETDCLEAVQRSATESPGCLVLAPTSSGQVTPPTVSFLFALVAESGWNCAASLHVSPCKDCLWVDLDLSFVRPRQKTQNT